VAIFRRGPPNGSVESWLYEESRFSTNIYLCLGNNKNRAIVTMECQSELVFDLSNCAVSTGEWLKRSIQWHEASRGLSATADRLVSYRSNWLRLPMRLSIYFGKKRKWYVAYWIVPTPQTLVDRQVISVIFSENKCSLVFRSLMESPGDLMKDNIADDHE